MTAKAKLAGNTLIYGHRKQDDVKWDISTPQLRAKAFLELFNRLREDWDVYSCDYWGKTKAEQTMQRGLYVNALAGDAQAAERLLTMRIDYEYEEWRIVDAPKSGDGEPRTVLARRPGKLHVKELRRQRDSGRYSLELSNGEEIEFAYVPINTTGRDWENGYMIHGFLIDAMYEKLGRDMDTSNKMEKMLSALNYLRLTLYYTIFPERMPLGKNLGIWQMQAIAKAETLIDQYGDNPVEKIDDKKKRPTELQAAQDVISELVLNYESALSMLERTLKGKYSTETVLEHDLPQAKATLTALKKRIGQ